MSFILDALKKLEREKEKREPGVVMVGPVPWGERDRRRGPGLAIAGALVAVVLAGSFFWLRSTPEPAATPGGDPESAAAPPARPETSVAPEAPAPAEATPPPPREAPWPAETTTAVGPEAPPPPLAEPPPAGVRTTTPVPFEEPPVAPSLDDAGEAAAEPITPPPGAPPEPEYRLTAISSRDGQPIALLNDRLVREGDRFGDVTIVKIGETSVEIEVKGERRTIGF